MPAANRYDARAAWVHHSHPDVWPVSARCLDDVQQATEHRRLDAAQPCSVACDDDASAARPTSDRTHCAQATPKQQQQQQQHPSQYDAASVALTTFSARLRRQRGRLARRPVATVYCWFVVIADWTNVGCRSVRNNDCSCFLRSAIACVVCMCMIENRVY